MYRLARSHAHQHMHEHKLEICGLASTIVPHKGTSTEPERWMQLQAKGHEKKRIGTIDARLDLFKALLKFGRRFVRCPCCSCTEWVVAWIDMEQEGSQSHVLCAQTCPRSAQISQSQQVDFIRSGHILKYN